jgi:hypothetical protein
MKLTGSRCQCLGCDEYFNSVTAFDKHRRGEAEDRYCLTTEQMLEKGYEKNKALFWTTGLKGRDFNLTA